MALHDGVDEGTFREQNFGQDIRVVGSDTKGAVPKQVHFHRDRDDNSAPPRPSCSQLQLDGSKTSWLRLKYWPAANKISTFSNPHRYNYFIKCPRTSW